MEIDVDAASTWDLSDWEEESNLDLDNASKY